MRATLRNSLGWVIFCALAPVCGLAGCGDDPPENTGNTQSDDSGDAGSSDNGEEDNESTDGDESETTDETTTDEDTTETDESDTVDGDTSSSTTSDDELPDPVLEELPPETPLSELDDDQLAEVCEAYLETASSITENLDGICPAQAVISARGSMSDEAAQQACVTAEATCTTQVEASKAALSEANCDQADECGATIEDFNACNRQVAALDQMVIVPVAELDAPACESVTVAEVSSFSITGGVQLLIWMQQASDAGGGAPTDEGGPCQRIQEQCPELGAVLNAFEGLTIPEL